MSTNSADVAILAYHPLKEKRADGSYDGNGNFGAEVIADVLRRAGIEVSLFPSMHALAGKAFCDNGNMHAVHSHGNEGPWSHLVTVIAERATPETDVLWEAICFASKLQSAPAADRVRRVTAHFDLSPYLRQYDIDEPHPADFLASFTPKGKLRAIARKMREEAAHG